MKLLTQPWKRQRNSSIGAIGLEFSLDKIYLVQLSQNRNTNVALHAIASIDYPDSRDHLLASPKLCKTLLSDVLKTHRFYGRDVVTCLPPGDLRLITVSYQASEGEEQERELLQRIAERLDEPVSEFVIDYLPIRAREKDKEKLALVAIARRKTVIEFLEFVRLCGFNVKALDIAPSAIKRLISSLPENETFNNVLTINFGRKKSYMVLMSGRRLLLDSEIEFGEQEIIEQLSETLDMSYDDVSRVLYQQEHQFSNASDSLNDNEVLNNEAIFDALQNILRPNFLKLVEEINRSLIYAASETRGGSVKQIYLLGGIACWRGVDKILNRMTHIPVTIPDYLSSISDNEFVRLHRAELPIMGVVTGLALRGLTHHE